METIINSTGGFQLKISDLIVYAGISFFVGLSCYMKWKGRHFDKLAAKLMGPPAYPIIGTGLEFLGTPEQIILKIMKIADDYGPEPLKIWLGTNFGVFIGKPEDIKIVLNSSKALEKAPFYRFLKDALGEGLVTAPVDKWRIHRRLIAPLFQGNLLNHFFPVFNETSEILISYLNKEVGKTQPFDLWKYILPSLLDMVCKNAMGYSLDAQSDGEVEEFSNAFTKESSLVGMRLYKPWLYPDIIFSIYLKLTGNCNNYKTLHKLPNKVIKKMKETYYSKRKVSNKGSAIYDSDNGEPKRLKIFLDKLLELNEVNANFSDDEIRDEVVTMMIAGSETNALTLCFCILLLAIHPNIQNKVYDEIYDVLGDSKETLTMEDTYKLVYMEQVIKETLRMYSIAPIILRILQDDVKIASGNHILPKGSTCIISPLATHYLSELYPNPKSFNPDNFNPENVNKRHNYGFIAFSGGLRGCIGNKYAMLLMKVVLSTFLRNFSVHTDIKLSDIKLKVDLMLRSSIGYPVNIRPRERKPRL